MLEAAQRKDEFLAMLGHELRNPLGPIMTAVELLARDPGTPREWRIVDRHARHLARLVDDLLDISRVTRGNVELRVEPVALASVLERAAEIAAPLTTRYGHRVEVDAAGDAVVSGDPVRLAQVFGNLLTNAAKFTPPGGRITVRVDLTAGAARVVVRDDGRGIERAQFARIFHPFAQADGQDARGGLGLGLAIVKDLVERHGGSISVESDGPGTGSAFTVVLPVAAAPAAAPEPAARADVRRREGARVLVVDDNEDIAELLSYALSEEGFTTAVAHDAATALATSRIFAPRAAVVDVGLPDIDGYELARAMRAEFGPGLTLIAATGYGKPRDRQRAVDAGFACHLVKPVTVEELVRTLDASLI
jgi:CheY-like chemotaxis protein/two-component sensor histidine kinase